jgi:SRSO17 transposase
MDWNARLWRRSCEQFGKFMVPITAPLGRSERRIAATHYVEGLLLPGERKSVEPMASRLQFDAQRLQQFIKDSPWDDRRVWQVIRRQVAPHLEPIEAWIVDETGWPKQGRHSVGVSHQYCGALGKQANCQVSVEVTISDGFVAAPMAGRLYLPESWTKDRPRCREAGVPEEVLFATKPQMALALIKEVLADEVDRAPVLGDSAYGDSYEFRQELRRLGLEFFLQVTPEEHKAWLHAVPTKPKGKYLRVDEQTAALARNLAQITTGLPQGAWMDCSWKAVDGEQRKTRLAWVEVYLMRGLKEPQGHLERLWLVVDWPRGEPEPYRHYLAQFDRQPTKALCLKLSRSRWHIEQYFQRSKGDLGFDHYEGRSWRGFHHHLVMSAIAYLFILTVYVSAKKNFWAHVGEESQGDPALVVAIHRMLSVLRDKIS